jgi:hypothetical protein
MSSRLARSLVIPGRSGPARKASSAALCVKARPTRLSANSAMNFDMLLPSRAASTRIRL